MPNNAERFAEDVAALEVSSKQGTLDEQQQKVMMFNAGASLLQLDEEGACFFDANTGDPHRVPPSQACQKVWSEYFEQVAPELLGWLASYGFNPPKQIKAKTPPPNSVAAKKVVKAVAQAKQAKVQNPQAVKAKAQKLASKRVKKGGMGDYYMLIGGGVLVGAALYTFMLSKKK